MQTVSPVRLRIEEFRIAKGWGQAELSRISGVPQSTISRLEGGQIGVVNLEHLERLAKAFGIHPREMILQEPE